MNDPTSLAHQGDRLAARFDGDYDPLIASLTAAVEKGRTVEYENPPEQEWDGQYEPAVDLTQGHGARSPKPLDPLEAFLRQL